MNQNYRVSPSLGEKPGQVTTITIMTLISGITNILASLVWSLLIVVGTVGVGILCVPVTILPGVLGVFEIIYAAKLLSNPPRPVQPSQVLSILEICAILFANVLSLVTGILALVFYNDPQVQEYFARLNSQQG
jgi:hypothetical protein